MTQDTLTKICSSCGIKKPLSAFLQMNSSGTARHGQICATCRKTQAEDAARLRKTDAEGGSATETGHKIDTKARMQGEKDKRELRETINENYHEDRKDTQIELNITKEKTDIKLQTEKKHHASLLSQRNFLGDKTPSKTQQTVENPTVTAAQHSHEEIKKAGFNFNTPYVDPQIAGQTRFQSQAFLQYRQWLGKNSPLVKGAEASMKQNAEKGIKPTTDPVEFIEQTWGPKSKR